jgi:hypothetical protein
VNTMIAGGFALLTLTTVATMAAAPAPAIELPTQPQAHSTSAEEPAVRKALGYYLEGHATGKGSAYAQVFHPDAKLFFNRDGKFSQVTSADYIARATGAPAPDEAQRKRRIDFIDVTGDAAVARITLEYPGVTMTDYMSLIKVDGEWRIVNKIFHANRQPARSE